MNKWKYCLVINKIFNFFLNLFSLIWFNFTDYTYSINININNVDWFQPKYWLNFCFPTEKMCFLTAHDICLLSCTMTYIKNIYYYQTIKSETDKHFYLSSIQFILILYFMISLKWYLKPNLSVWVYIYEMYKKNVCQKKRKTNKIKKWNETIKIDQMVSFYSYLCQFMCTFVWFQGACLNFEWI